MALELTCTGTIARTSISPSFFVFVFWLLHQASVLLNQSDFSSMIQGLDQRCSTFMHVTVHWSKKVSGPGTLQRSFNFQGKQGHLPSYRNSAYPLLPLLMMPFSAVWAVQKGCLTPSQAKALMGQ